MVPSQLQGSRKMATSHGPHQDSSSEWRSADGGHLFAQRASLSAGLLLLLLLLLHSLSVKSRRCITTTFPLYPCATLKALDIPGPPGPPTPQNYLIYLTLCAFVPSDTGELTPARQINAMKFAKLL